MVEESRTKLHKIVDPVSEDVFYAQLPEEDPPFEKEIESPSTGNVYEFRYMESDDKDVKFEIEVLNLDEFLDEKSEGEE